MFNRFTRVAATSGPSGPADPGPTRRRRDQQPHPEVRGAEPEGPSPGPGHGEVRRTGEGEERRQNQSQAFPRRNAGRRRPDALSSSGRHGRDVGDERRPDERGVEGLLPGRSSLHVRNASAGRCRHGRPVRHQTGGSPPRQGRYRSGVLGTRFPQPDQQPPRRDQGRRYRRAEDPGTSVAGLHRPVHRTWRQPGADALSGALHRPGNRHGGRSGKPVTATSFPPRCSRCRST